MGSILIIASYAPSLMNFRGALIERLIDEGFAVHVACPQLDGDARVRAWLADRGVNAHDVPLSRTGLDPVSDIRTLLALAALMRRIRPGVCLGYTIKPVIWGMLAARLAGVPRRVALITGLGYAFTDAPSSKRRLTQAIAKTLYRIALRQATLIFFQHPDDASDFTNWNVLPSRTPVRIVNGSGVDTTYYLPEPFPEGPIRFLLIARLLGDKGIREYVAAARIVKALGREAEFQIVGGLDTNPDGITAEEIADWTQGGIVSWQDTVTDVRPYVRSTHVYVLPSYREGTPRTVLEAMAMGRPIVTTDAPGCRETVREGVNGFLVPVRDADALAGAMLKFLDDPSLVPRMGGKSRAYVLEKYDVDKVNASMLEAIGI